VPQHKSGRQKHLGRIPLISVVNHLAMGTYTTKCPGQHGSHRALIVNQSRLSAQNQKHSGRNFRRRDRPLFSIHQWERQTASIKRQRSIPSVLTASLRQWETIFIHLRSFISATKSITQCGNQCWEHGCTHGTHAGSLGLITQSGKMQQHHRSTTTKLQVGVLRNKLHCIFVGF
jgi:hypothetical protein